MRGGRGPSRGECSVMDTLRSQPGPDKLRPTQMVAGFMRGYSGWTEGWMVSSTPGKLQGSGMALGAPGSHLPLRAILNAET